jgi:integrase
MLNHLRDDDVVRLSSDDIRTGLAREKHDHNLREFLAAAQVRALLDHAAAHDAHTFRLTRKGRRDMPKHKPIAPFLRAAVLTGMRLEELLGLQWEHVPEPSDRIHLPADIAKGGRARVIDLGVSPSALPERPEDATGSVFGLTEGEAVAARKRLTAMGAPAFTFHGLRRTCGTMLACSSIYGTAGVYLTARRLGHSVSVAERHYLGVVSVDPEARTLEQALGLSGRIVSTQAAYERASAAYVGAVQEQTEDNHTDMLAELNALVRALKPNADEATRAQAAEILRKLRASKAED